MVRVPIHSGGPTQLNGVYVAIFRTAGRLELDGVAMREEDIDLTSPPEVASPVKLSVQWHASSLAIADLSGRRRTVKKTSVRVRFDETGRPIRQGTH